VLPKSPIMGTLLESQDLNLRTVAGSLVRQYRAVFIILLVVSLLQSALTGSTIYLEIS